MQSSSQKSSSTENITAVDRKKNNRKEKLKKALKCRRTKMSACISELRSMIPKHGKKSGRLDGLVVLEDALEHVREIQNPPYHPFLSDKDLNSLITQASGGFVFVVNCDHGQILYTSETVTQVLKYLPEDLVSKNVFDYVHPDDLADVKKQLLRPDVGTEDKNIDNENDNTNLTSKVPKKLSKIKKTKQTLSNQCTGNRRSFICRMKYKVYTLNEDKTINIKFTELDGRYGSIQFTGYLKDVSHITESENRSKKLADNNGIELTTNKVLCLVAVCRNITDSAPPSILSDTIKPLCFTSKHSTNGEFLYVDLRSTYIVGFLPQELLGTSIYEYVHQDDVARLEEVNKLLLEKRIKNATQIYKFRTKDETYVLLRSEWKSFRNPWTKRVDFISAINVIIKSHSNPDIDIKSESSLASLAQTNHDIFTEQQLSRSPEQIENGKIENVIVSCKEESEIDVDIADTELDAKINDCNNDDSPSQTDNKIKSEWSIDEDESIQLINEIIMKDSTKLENNKSINVNESNRFDSSYPSTPQMILNDFDASCSSGGSSGFGGESSSSGYVGGSSSSGYIGGSSSSSYVGGSSSSAYIGGSSSSGYVGGFSRSGYVGGCSSSGYFGGSSSSIYVGGSSSSGYVGGSSSSGYVGGSFSSGYGCGSGSSGFGRGSGSSDRGGDVDPSYPMIHHPMIHQEDTKPSRSIGATGTFSNGTIPLGYPLSEFTLPGDLNEILGNALTPYIVNLLQRDASGSGNKSRVPWPLQ